MLDTQITKATGAKYTEPATYAAIFERGIDPDVDNPELCHDHSDIPETCPPWSDIIQYQGRVRSRITSLTATGEAECNRKLGRSLWLAFEHEVMHLETYIYMLLQSSKTLFPPGSTKPDFERLASEAELRSVPNEWFKVPKQEVRIGIQDPDNDLGPDRYFVWDNEKPPRDVVVDEFEAQGRPISNGEYARYLLETRSTTFPASWTINESEAGLLNGCIVGATPKVLVNAGQDHAAPSKHHLLNGVSVRTVYGPISLQHARHWPVMASYDELAAYAKWSDGRIPTFEEARSIYSYVEDNNQGVEEKVLSPLISAVNG